MFVVQFQSMSNEIFFKICIAYDVPFFGLRVQFHRFKNKSKAVGVVQYFSKVFIVPHTDSLQIGLQSSFTDL